MSLYPFYVLLGSGTIRRSLNVTRDGVTKDRKPMTIAFLNDEFVPLEEARISPMDRGFLFGDGIYEVIPSYGGKLIGLDLHLARLENGLNEIGINTSWSRGHLTNIFTELMSEAETGTSASTFRLLGVSR
jgi:branched-subunit amino acid aminotransferase/4-amino-4-deoxychorismate lyase